jgi:hypothetical protein
MRRILTILLLAGVVLILDAPAFAQGCSMCRSALESSPEGKLLASSFAQGIVVMLVLPYALFGTFGYLVYRAFRKQRKDAASGVSG